MAESSSLNPCYNGRYSQRKLTLMETHSLKCLNPCYNGRYSQSVMMIMLLLQLISLNPCSNGRYSQRDKIMKQTTLYKVLILVLMEDALRESNLVSTRHQRWCLNPCFNGRYSQRKQDIWILCISRIGIYKTNNACSYWQKLTDL